MSTEEYLEILTGQIRCSISCRLSDEAGDSVSRGDRNGRVAGSRQLGFLILGLGVMTAVCFADYTRIAARAREILTGEYLLLTAGLLLAGVQANGIYRWIYLGPLGSVGVQPLLLLTVPLCAAVLYRYRGQSYRALVKGVLWMLPAFALAIPCHSLSTLAVLFFSCLTVLCVAVYRGWFRVSRRLCLAGAAAAAVLVPLAGCGYIWFWGAGYQQDRLRMILQWDSEGNYLMEIVRNILEQSRIVGESPAFAAQAEGITMSEIMITGIAGYYGLMAAAALTAALLFLFIKFLRISLGQKNCLGMLMGTGCAAVLLVQTLIYLAANVGIFNLGTDCPLVSAGGSTTVITYMLLGILLSICRYQNTAPEIRRFAWMFRTL